MADTSYLESLQNGVGMDPNDHSSMSGSIIWTTGVLMFVVFVFAIARAAVRLKYQPIYPWSRRDQARIIGWDDCKLLIFHPQQRSLQFPSWLWLCLTTLWLYSLVRAFRGQRADLR